MASRDKDSYVYYAASTNQDGFTVDLNWAQQQQEQSILCTHCENTRAERRGEIERVVVDNRSAEAVHWGSVSQFGGVEVLSREVVEILGYDRLSRVGRIVPLVSVAGFEYQTHVALVVAPAPGLMRGPAPHEPALCKACGRLLYWPGWPPSTWYVLRRDWQNGIDLQVLDDCMLCSPALWEKTLAPRKLPQLSADAISVVDEPTDGLPADYEELIAFMKRERRLK